MTKFKMLVDCCDLCEDSERPKREVAKGDGDDAVIYLCEDCLNKMFKVLKEDK